MIAQQLIKHKHDAYDAIIYADSDDAGAISREKEMMNSVTHHEYSCVLSLSQSVELFDTRFYKGKETFIRINFTQSNQSQ